MAARGGGAGAIEEQVGRKARCRAPGSRKGGCHPRGSGGVGAKACCHPPCLGRSRERGTSCRLPSIGGARRRGSIGPSTKDVQYHCMAASQLVEDRAAVCPGTAVCLGTALSLPTDRPAIGAWKAAMAAAQTLMVDEERCYPASPAEMKEPLRHRR